jgi:DNA processing protein
MFAPRSNEMTDRPTEQAAVLALVEASRREWHRTATLIVEAGSAVRLLDGGWTGLEPFDTELANELRQRVTPETLSAKRESLAGLADDGIRLITVLDPDYPPNLRLVYNLPPFLFLRGTLAAADDRAVAVVGTRTASPAGLEQARALATELARQGVTVMSGLARGIDTAAHEAALAAGGRTVAVLGSGIRAPIYPAENAGLAERIIVNGALVSQFWPDAAPTRHSFPMRNVVTSGISVGTVVIEASATSGAKMQARLALEHAKRVFLLRSLVMQQDWARRYADQRGAIVVDSVDDILRALATTTAPATQLSLV